MIEMQEVIEEILKGMKRKYRGVLEVERLTKELADILSAGDRESVQLLLNMRQTEIERVGDEHYALREIVGALDSGNREYIASLMNGEKQSNQVSESEQKIVQMAVQTRNVLERIIAVDKVLSRKLAGKDSYYQ